MSTLVQALNMCVAEAALLEPTEPLKTAFPKVMAPLLAEFERLERDLAAARAELEAARKDAERYRWLTKMWPTELTRLVHSHHTQGDTSSEIHAAIDAALRQDESRG